MADTVFNIAKGKVAKYGMLDGGANDQLIIVPIETSGLESDATLQDYDTLSALLAASNNEQSTMGRKTAASVTVNVDDTNNRQEVDMADVVWTAASGNAISRLVVCYDPDTTTGTDADLVPLVLLDAVATPGGGDITYAVNASGFYRAS